MHIFFEGFDLFCHIIDAGEERLDKIAFFGILRQTLAFCQTLQISCVL